MAGQDVQSVLDRYELAANQEPMHGQPGQIRRAPSTDQKRVRREIKRKADLEDPVSDATQLLRQASVTNNLAERQRLIAEAERLNTVAAQQREAEDGYQVEGAKIRDVMVPGRTHEHTTADTDWLLGLQPTASVATDSQGLIAEATLWFGRVSDDVKSYPEEFAEQARGLAHRTAGKFDDPAAAERLFLDEVGRLHNQAVTAGHVVLATDQGFDPDPDGLQFQAASSLPQVADSALPPDTFSTLNGGGTVPPEATDSNRAPALQEIQNYTGWDGTSVVPQGDSGAAAANGQTANADATADGFKGFPVGSALHTASHQKESHMAQEHATCPTCGGHGRVAARVFDPKTAYSGLPQIDQIMDPAADAQAPTPLPPDVAFPLVWNQNNVPSAISQAEQQISERNSRSPLLTSGTLQQTANGRDNSGWIGDMGGKGTDYPGYSTPQYGNESNLGQPDPVWGTGGDNGNQPMKPYGAQEASDYTNDQGQNWQPGQPTQDDQGYREVAGEGTALNTRGSADPYIAAAQAEIARQQQFIAARARSLAGR